MQLVTLLVKPPRSEDELDDTEVYDEEESKKNDGRCSRAGRTCCIVDYSYGCWKTELDSCVSFGKLSRTSDVQEYEIVGSIGWEGERSIRIIVTD